MFANDTHSNLAPGGPRMPWLWGTIGGAARAAKIIERGVAEAIADQIACGIDIPTDGEIARENYIHYHCRHLQGFDFANLTRKQVRGGTYEAALPTISGPVSVRDRFLVDDWKRAQINCRSAVMAQLAEAGLAGGGVRRCFRVKLTKTGFPPATSSRDD